MTQNVLNKARRWYRKRNFQEVIRLLESQIFRFRENFDFFFLLGSACLHSGDYGGAASYLRRAAQLRPDHVPTLLGMAALELKKADVEEALKHWLRVYELEPHNTIARRGLALARKGLQGNDIEELWSSGKAKDLYPAIPFSPSRLLVPGLLAALAAAVLLGAIFLLPRLKTPRGGRPGLEEIDLSLSQPPLTGPNRGAYYQLSEKEILNSFSAAKKHLLQYRDNLAVKELNRLLLSNASLPVKEKARLLKSMVAQPDFSTIRDAFPYAEVRAIPFLYDGCHVVWAGKVANLEVGKSAITFNLLVGYQQERELEGIVPVRLLFPLLLENGADVEVLGRVVVEEQGPVPVPGPAASAKEATPNPAQPSAGAAIRLEGLAVHRLLLRK